VNEPPVRDKVFSAGGFSPSIFTVLLEYESPKVAWFDDEFYVQKMWYTEVEDSGNLSDAVLGGRGKVVDLYLGGLRSASRVAIQFRGRRLHTIPMDPDFFIYFEGFGEIVEAMDGLIRGRGIRIGGTRDVAVCASNTNGVVRRGAQEWANAIGAEYFDDEEKFRAWLLKQ
jgi:hypothetical protein